MGTKPRSNRPTNGQIAEVDRQGEPLKVMHVIEMERRRRGMPMEGRTRHGRYASVEEILGKTKIMEERVQGCVMKTGAWVFGDL